MELIIHFFNIWAVLVGFLVYIVIGALWYSPILFGNLWLRLVGKTADDINKADANKSMALSAIPAILSVLALALILGFADATTALDGLIIGSVVSIGFAATSYINLVLFEDRKMSLCILNSGYLFVSANVAAVILTLWK